MMIMNQNNQKRSKKVMTNESNPPRKLKTV